MIYNPAITHPWSHFSKRSAKAAIEFFDASLGTPDPIDASSQVWQIKELFNLLGLVGMGIFAVNGTLLLTHTHIFRRLRAESENKTGSETKTISESEIRNQPEAGNGRKTMSVNWRRQSVLSAAAIIIFSAVSYLPVVIAVKSDNNGKLLFAQNTTFGIGLWAAACGLFMIVCMVIRYKSADEENRISLEETGIWQDRQKSALTAALGVSAAVLTYLWVGIADYFFKTDFRIWVLAAKAINAEKVLIALFPNLLLFLVFYGASSVLVNCFECRSEEGGKSERCHTFVQMAAAAAPSAILILMQYSYLFSTGRVLFENNNAHSMILWLFPMVVLIPASVSVSRQIYRETKNPYLPAIVNAILITLISCANTSTWG